MSTDYMPDSLQRSSMQDQRYNHSVLQPGGIRAKKASSKGYQNPHITGIDINRITASEKFSNGVLSSYNSKLGKKSVAPPTVSTSLQQSARNTQGFVSKAARGQQKLQADIINFIKEELLATWDAYLIPDYHKTVFLDCIVGLKPEDYTPIIAKEIEELKNEKAPIQNAIRAIIARESCISQIMELEKIL